MLLMVVGKRFGGYVMKSIFGKLEFQIEHYMVLDVYEVFLFHPQADLNNDGSVDVVDVVILVSSILND